MNKGINKELLNSVQFHGINSEEKDVYNEQLLDKYIRLITAGCQYASRVRLVTVELLIASLKLMVVKGKESILKDGQLAALEGAREDSTLILRNFYKSEEIFLDMFEDEYRNFYKEIIFYMLY